MVVLAPATPSAMRASVCQVGLSDSSFAVLVDTVLEGCAGGLVHPRLTQRVVDQDDAFIAVLALDFNVSVFTH